MSEENIIYTKGSSNCFDNISGVDIVDCANLRDDDDGTYAYITVYGGATSKYGWAYFEGLFDKARYMKRAHFTYQPYQVGSICQVNVTLMYYDTGWHTLQSFTYYTSGSKTTKIYSAGYPGTTLLRTAVEIYAHTDMTVTFRVHELEGFSDVYLDSRFRMRKDGETLKMGCEALDTHKLRVRDNGVVRGVPLLSTGNVNASPLRIYDGSSVKALPLATE